MMFRRSLGEDNAGMFGAAGTRQHMQAAPVHCLCAPNPFVPMGDFYVFFITLPVIFVSLL
jgi:hypothetical protein